MKYKSSQTVKTDIKLLRRLVAVIKPQMLWLLIAFFFNGLYSAIDAGFVYLLKPILNQGFIGRNVIFIDWLPWLILLAFILRSLANIVSSCAMTQVTRNIISYFRKSLFNQLLYLPANFYNQHSPTDILSVMIFNVEQITNASAGALTTIAQSGFFVIGLLLVMFSISAKLSLFCLVIMPFTFYLVRYSSKRMRGLSHRVQETIASISETTKEAIDGYQVVRSFGAEGYEMDKFNQFIQRHRTQELKSTLIRTLTVSSVQFVFAIVLAFIVYLALSHHVNLTAGAFVALVSAFLAILKPLKNITRVNAIVQKGLAAIESIFVLLDQPIEMKKGDRDIDRLKGDICYQQVSFAYKPDAPPILKDINLTIKGGHMLALVGQSGGGKTTLINLLLRFYDDYQGNILIDGIDIRDMKFEDLRRQFALVSQHTVLFNDTIANNIAYGQPTNDRESIIVAAKAANAWEFIDQLPQKLDTIIGSNGSLLSGGQRQRIAIARAIWKNAPILILDEATASLDSQSEYLIQQSLGQLMAKTTTVVIAHRLSTVEKADLIVVLEQGRIVEMGTHQSLLRAQSHYATLCRHQLGHQ